MFLNDNEDLVEGDELVPLLFAKDESHAEEYRQLLADHDITATIGDDDWQGSSDEEDSEVLGYDGVPVLVSASLVAEAGMIIAESEDALGYEFDDEGELELTDDEDEILSPSPDMMLMEGAEAGIPMDGEEVEETGDF